MRNAIQSLKRGMSWVWGHKIRTVVLLLVLTFLAPKPIRSQFVDPCCAILATGLTTISNTLSSVIGGGLNGGRLGGMAPNTSNLNLESRSNAYTIRALRRM